MESEGIACFWVRMLLRDIRLVRGRVWEWHWRGEDAVQRRDCPDERVLLGDDNREVDFMIVDVLVFLRRGE